MVQTLEERVFRTPKIAASDKLKKEEVKRLIKPVCHIIVEICVVLATTCVIFTPV